MIRGLPALAVARVRVLGADQKKSGLWGRERYNLRGQGEFIVPSVGTNGAIGYFIISMLHLHNKI